MQFRSSSCVSYVIVRFRKPTAKGTTSLFGRVRTLLPFRIKFFTTGALLNGQLSSIDFDKRARSSGPCDVTQVRTVTETVCVDYVGLVKALFKDFFLQNTLICILFGIVNTGLWMFVAIDMRIEKVRDFVKL